MIYQLNKPIGLLSRDLVDYVRYRVPEKKVGHGGALDPLASGSLLIATGIDTKKCTDLLKKDKTYKFSIILGLSTPTGDLEADRIMTDTLYWQKKILKEDLIQEINRKITLFIGQYKQRVPLYSSVKVDGYCLREVVREGQNISFKDNILHAKYKQKEIFLAIPQKIVQIYKLELEKIVMFTPTELVFLLNKTCQQVIQNIDVFSKRTERKERKIVYNEIINSMSKIINLIKKEVQKTSIIPVAFFIGKVSSGTYIRKLAIDIAKELNTTATCLSIDRQIIKKTNIHFTLGKFDY